MGIPCQLRIPGREMAQRSITSFFAKGPAAAASKPSPSPAAAKSTSSSNAKSGTNSTDRSGSPLKADTSENVIDEDSNSPIKVTESVKRRRRARVISSSDEEDVENGTPPKQVPAEKAEPAGSPSKAARGDGEEGKAKNSGKRRSSVDASENGPKAKRPIKAEEDEANEEGSGEKPAAKVTPKSTKKATKADKKATPKAVKDEEETTPKNSKAKKATPKSKKTSPKTKKTEVKTAGNKCDDKNEIKKESPAKEEQKKEESVKEDKPKTSSTAPAPRNPFAAMM